MNYTIYLIPDNGEGVPMQLRDWDGEEPLTLRLSAFANNAVIEIEPAPIREAE